MVTNYRQIDWEHILQLFQSYNGTKRNFCKEHNISVDQFYYYRKKHGLIKKKSTHQVSNNDTQRDETNILDNSFVKLEANYSLMKCNQSTIIIEIGKATLHIDNQIEERTFSTIVKVLAASC